MMQLLKITNFGFLSIGFIVRRKNSVSNADLSYFARNCNNAFFAAIYVITHRGFYRFTLFNFLRFFLFLSRFGVIIYNFMFSSFLLFRCENACN